MNALAETHESLGDAFAAFRKGLFGFLKRQVAQTDVAEDLLQEVFLKALDAEQRGTRPRHLSGWLFAIARSTLIDHYRAQRTVADLSADMDSPDTAPLPSEELAECIRPFIQQLPELYRDTLVATELEGVPMKVLAERWNVSLSALKSRASRGRQLLKERVLDCCRVDLSVTGKILGYEKNPGTPGCEAACD